MKERTKKGLLAALALLFGGVLLTGCTQNFCSDIDRANIAYPYEQGVTVYVDGKENVPELYESVAWQPLASAGNTELYAYCPVDDLGYPAAAKATYLRENIIKSAISAKYNIPSQEYWKRIDQFILETAIASALEADSTLTFTLATIKATDINPFSKADCNGTEEGVTLNSNSVLRKYGYLKFYGADNKLWTNFDKWTDNLIASTEDNLGPYNCPSKDFRDFYKGRINTLVANLRTCISTSTGHTYGSYGNERNWRVMMQNKDIGYAYSKGFLEGLIVFPVAWLVDVMSEAFDPALSGIGQIWALILVTLIVRLVVMGLTFKSTLDQQKTQAIQPELAKLQQKYPNSNTNQSEKQKFAQEQMALYRRNKISPFSMIFAMVIQFIIFIAVWGSFQGSAALSTGAVLNLRLSDTISSVLFNVSGAWYTNVTG
ncbi:MAG: YidC/Oxa1 family membrane protein insertase, partial [Bacilli bacterium]|nr:YidC/Oxa1 family membrane protein insertase [Bacilli bacterium]